MNLGLYGLRARLRTTMTTTSSSERFDCDARGLGCRLGVSNGLELGFYTTAVASSATIIMTTIIVTTVVAVTMTIITTMVVVGGAGSDTPPLDNPNHDRDCCWGGKDPNCHWESCGCPFPHLHTIGSMATA